MLQLVRGAGQREISESTGEVRDVPRRAIEAADRDDESISTGSVGDGFYARMGEEMEDRRAGARLKDGGGVMVFWTLRLPSGWRRCGFASLMGIGGVVIG